MRQLQIMRAGLGGMTHPLDDDDELTLRIIERLVVIVPLDAEWSIVEAGRVDYLAASTLEPTNVDRLSAAFG